MSKQRFRNWTVGVGLTGIGTILMISFIAGVGLTPSAVQTVDWYKMPLWGRTCETDGDPAYKDCQLLAEHFGISPEWYIGDTLYRDHVNNHQQQAVKAGHVITETLVDFTLEQLADNRIVILQDTWKHLRALQAREQAAREQ